MSLILRSLNINLETWGPRKGMYTGDISFMDEGVGGMQLVLDPALSNIILAAASEAVAVATSKSVERFNQAVHESIKAATPPQITAPKVEEDIPF